MSRKKIVSAKDVVEGQTVRFEVERNGKIVKAFLARFQGELVAYENVCRHLPLSLDFHDGRFFTGDGKHFVCFNHNALYEPLTGLCVRGPCEGESLRKIKIEVLDGEVWAG